MSTTVLRITLGILVLFCSGCGRRGPDTSWHDGNFKLYFMSNESSLTKLGFDLPFRSPWGFLQATRGSDCKKRAHIAP